MNDEVQFFLEHHGLTTIIPIEAKLRSSTILPPILHSVDCRAKPEWFLVFQDLSHSSKMLYQSYLLDMKKNLMFNTTRSTKLVHWNESTDCCSWEGVTCNGGLVVGLNLVNESIYDGLDNSSSLFCLQYLQNLNLAYNELDSPIPPEFGNLTNLRFLNLSHAGFGEQIPIEISRLTRLVSLDLSTFYLKLENPDLASLVHNLTWLTELYLDGVDISSQGNEWCHAVSSSLPNLRVLSMSDCNLQGPPDSSLLKLQSLSIIHLNYNNFSAPVPEFFSYFRNLTSLCLSNCGLNGQFPKKIFQFPTLETIDLSFNELGGSLPEFHPNGSLQSLVLTNTTFSGTLPDSIGNLKRLSKIDLSGCNFSGSIPNSMANLTQLVHLDLSSNSFTGSILNSIANLIQLVYLDLSSNSFTGSIPNSMANLTRLSDLDFSSNNFIGSIPNFMANLTELAYFRMSSNSFIGPIPSFNMAKNLHMIDLSDNHLTGQFTFTHWKELPSLVFLNLSNNKLSGQIHEFSNSSLPMVWLDLSSNYLEGPIPTSIGKLQSLGTLLFSSNNFNGSFQLNVFLQQLTNLIELDLSDNSLLIEYNGTNSSLTPFPLIKSLRLASLKLKTFPSFLRNQTSLLILDLSRNQIHGEIPNWIWELDLTHLNLSYNYLEGPLPSLSSFGILDLRSNQFQGQLPTPLPSCSYLDLSLNNFSSVIPIDIGNSLSNTGFLYLSSNKLNGHIPEAICNATSLYFLDLSNNSLSGTIPHCLIAMSETLKVLNLRRNNLTGKISDVFPSNCRLQTLSLNRNLLEGMVPNSLANCTNLELLDIGNNRIQDEFPCHLKDISSLRVLILRSNKFYGSVGCGGLNATWLILQIVDLASNDFSGKLSIKSFANSKAMIANNEVQSELNYLHSVVRIETILMQIVSGRLFIEMNYQDAIAIFIKGLERELVKISTLVTLIDLSCNNLDGPIPEEIEVLKSLYVLNLSHNAFTGRIPPSLGKLSKLESLDLSNNKLTGGIPMQLADSLTFLSVLNLSFNQLVGPIPYIKQFATFSEDSYEGNKGLCGQPLKAECGSADRRPPAPFEDIHSKSGPLIDWNYLCVELGFVFGFGMVIGPLVLWKRWRIRYYKHADDIFFRIFPQLYFRWEKNHQVQRHRIRMQRH
ncbi:receptor-like protein 6 isoform X2 [Quercus lobata]|uniref:receptor-like protein 6 isoform X2 n=1 Tax=Quercus lobata TaxID=97700 RepID=UPI0012472793|nr:receptor-like protein 6 isoform X2 [Quercus lobata]